MFVRALQIEFRYLRKFRGVFFPFWLRQWRHDGHTLPLQSKSFSLSCQGDFVHMHRGSIWGTRGCQAAAPSSQTKTNSWL